MNRRRFIQSVVAVFSLPAAPALSFRSATATLPTAVAVPAHARSWAIYMSVLHGDCSPQTLQKLLNIPALDAKNYVTQLIADGSLKPNPFLHSSVSELVKSNDGSFLDKVKKRLDMKARVESDEAKFDETSQPGEPSEPGECLDAETEMPEGGLEVSLEGIAEGEPEELETLTPEETVSQG